MCLAFDHWKIVGTNLLDVTALSSFDCIGGNVFEEGSESNLLMTEFRMRKNLPVLNSLIEKLMRLPEKKS
jgi:hypothetical protein